MLGRASEAGAACCGACCVGASGGGYCPGWGIDLISLVSHEERRPAVTRTLLLALLLRCDGTRQIRQDLAGAHDQLGDLILGLCWVLRIDRGDVAEWRVVG